MYLEYSLRRKVRYFTSSLYSSERGPRSPSFFVSVLSVSWRLSFRKREYSVTGTRHPSSPRMRGGVLWGVPTPSPTRLPSRPLSLGVYPGKTSFPVSGTRGCRWRRLRSWTYSSRLLHWSWRKTSFGFNSLSFGVLPLRPDEVIVLLSVFPWVPRDVGKRVSSPPRLPRMRFDFFPIRDLKGVRKGRGLSVWHYSVSRW